MGDEPEDLRSEKSQQAVLVRVEHHDESRAAQRHAAHQKADMRERLRRLSVLAALSVVVFLAVLGWRLLAPPGPRTGAPPPSSPQIMNPEFSAWSKTALDDPLALQAYLERFPTGHHAAEAQKILRRLEDKAWDGVLSQKDAHAKIKELDRFGLLYKNSARAEEAASLRQATGDVVASVQAQLLAQGFSSGPVDGVITERTIADVERYQTKMGLAVTGLIDVALLQQLQATAADQHGMGVPAASLEAFTNKSASAKKASAKAGTTFRDCYVCPEMVWLPPGQFQMGDLQGIGEPDELPVHTVSIAYELAVGKYEVTFEEWDACVADGGCRYLPNDMGWGRGTRPVINVSWTDAQEYAAWLSRKTGKTYRLLSEAEWEYAARAGSKTAYAFGDSPDELCDHANHADSSTDYSWKNKACSDGFSKQTAPAGSFEPNAFGVHDMHGNVWEWVEDCWHESYASAPTDGAAWTKACDATSRPLRGGSWSVQASNLRNSYRYRFSVAGRMPFFGFRAARQ